MESGRRGIHAPCGGSEVRKCAGEALRRGKVRRSEERAVCDRAAWLQKPMIAEPPKKGETSIASARDSVSPGRIHRASTPEARSLALCSDALQPAPPRRLSARVCTSGQTHDVPPPRIETQVKGCCACRSDQIESNFNFASQCDSSNQR